MIYQKNPTTGATYIKCNATGKWLTVKSSFTKKEVISLQKKLNLLGYQTIETQVLDTQTKKKLEAFFISLKDLNHMSYYQNYDGDYANFLITKNGLKQLNLAYRQKKKALKKQHKK